MREGTEKPNAFSRKPAPKPPFSRKRKPNSLRKRNSKRKKQRKRKSKKKRQRKKKKREGAEEPNAFSRNLERGGHEHAIWDAGMEPFTTNTKTKEPDWMRLQLTFLWTDGGTVISHANIACIQGSTILLSLGLPYQ
jgi:hypothetical protein